MAYKPKTDSRDVTDHTYASEIASKRPMLMTRVQCEVEGGDGDETLRGSDDPAARMNMWLGRDRGGRG